MVHSVECPLEFVLQQLQSYRRLRKLSITTTSVQYDLLGDTMVHPLSSLLLSEVPLQSLELNRCRFRRDHLVPLLHTVPSCLTLVRLVLTGFWENQAAHEMAAFIRQPRESTLRELCLGGQYFSDEVGAVMTSILTPPEGCTQQSSMGSLLRVLEWDTHLRDIAVLLAALTNKRSQISTLSLRSLDGVTSRQLTRYLPDIMNLRNLHVKRIWDCDPATFPPAFRLNGSLQRVSFHSVSGWVLFGTAEKRSIQSYCDRNRCTCSLLQTLEDEDWLLRLSLHHCFCTR
jgi:hypothetical protein